MQLRDYQQAAYAATIDHIKRCIEPCCIEVATGGGKSFIIAAIADWIFTESGKRVLCLAPSKELVEQNHEKYLITGNPASIYSASAGQKSLRHPVVFGTPLTVKNNLRRFEGFAAIVIDEAHGLTPTIKEIINALRRKNPNIRVIGLSATPYRMNEGYIYQIDENDMPTGHDGYFKKLLYKITAHELIARGYLTPPCTPDDISDHYDTSEIDFRDQKTIEQAFEGKGRKTSKIVADIVSHSANRRSVMIFASSIRHAKEVMESLPPEKSELVTGETKKADREAILKRFKANEIKYLVNVAVLTTGFDAPCVDVVAILRATESAALLQQIIGRGLRLDDHKKDVLVLDYAENIERHCPDGDIFNPEIVQPKKTGGGDVDRVECPACHTVNLFTCRPNPDGLRKSENGYFMDLNGDELEMPSHYGRRCLGQTLVAGGIYQQCSYRWATKECPECGHDNDIAARVCEKCKGEIIDPNEKLVLEYKKIKRDPYRASVDIVEFYNWRYWTSQSGNASIRVDIKTDCRQFSCWFTPKMRQQWDLFCNATIGEVLSIGSYSEAWQDCGKAPTTVRAVKDKKSGFYKIISFNEEPEIELSKLA